MPKHALIIHYVGVLNKKERTRLILAPSQSFLHKHTKLLADEVVHGRMHGIHLLIKHDAAIEYHAGTVPGRTEAKEVASCLELLSRRRGHNPIS